jgi:hypothetical protein
LYSSTKERKDEAMRRESFVLRQDTPFEVKIHAFREGKVGVMEERKERRREEVYIHDKT